MIELDKYYTPKRVVDICISRVKALGVGFSEVIEPSAGNGAFLEGINNNFHCPKFLYDIKPEHSAIVEQDFLKLDLQYKKDRLIIGNPPFGSRNSLIIKFFKKSIELGDYIAFVLPVSQMNNVKQLYEFDLVESVDLGFQEYSGVKLHCCFNIYKRPISGLNKKPKLPVIENLEVVEYRRDKTDSYRKKIKDDHFHSICSWGSVGEKPTFIGEFALELYFYSENNKIKDVVKSIDWKKEVFSISAKRLPKGLALEIIDKRLKLIN